ncbi:hypothetical protein HNP21_006154 [Bacillus aryabhattai]|uniref:Uncharacterized protein n=1 Tax=Priestia aryabhattai TaxID=412384 RepID=A0A7W3RI21_PRIAR|nr:MULTISPECIES: hypothetical protein [Priestia]MBA9042976.1 hypothetical protein [Priestia aryabhattai]MED4758136.1 hypothetical protein [Priestia megaterium]
MVQLTLIISMLALSMASVLFVMNIFKVGIVGAMRSSNTLSKVSLSLMGVYTLSFTAFLFMINNV